MLRSGELARRAVAVLGWRCPFPMARAAHDPVVLIYHGISSRADSCGMNARRFEEQLVFLKEHFAIVSPKQFAGTTSEKHRTRVMLTFDDGFRNNAEVVAPILRRHQVPAVFFVSSRHTTPGKYLWFSYLRALKSYFQGNGFMLNGEFMDMSGSRRRSTMARIETMLLSLRPHPAKMYEVMEEELPSLSDFASHRELDDTCSGMTVEQLQELAQDPLFTIGAHTIDHPFLTKCEETEAARQMRVNKDWLEQVCKTRCDMVAYPLGDYNHAVLTQARQCGFRYGYSVERKLSVDAALEFARVGIYYPSLNELGCKVRWSKLVVRLHQVKAAIRA